MASGCYIEDTWLLIRPWFMNFGVLVFLCYGRGTCQVGFGCTRIRRRREPWHSMPTGGASGRTELFIRKRLAFCMNGGLRHACTFEPLRVFCRPCPLPEQLYRLEFISILVLHPPGRKEDRDLGSTGFHGQSWQHYQSRMFQRLQCRTRFCGCPLAWWRW